MQLEKKSLPPLRQVHKKCWPPTGIAQFLDQGNIATSLSHGVQHLIKYMMDSTCNNSTELNSSTVRARLLAAATIKFFEVLVRLQIESGYKTRAAAIIAIFLSGCNRKLHPRL